MATASELYGVVHLSRHDHAPEPAVKVARAYDGFARRVGDSGVLTGERITDDMGAAPEDPAWIVRFPDGETDAYFSEELDIL